MLPDPSVTMTLSATVFVSSAATPANIFTSSTLTPCAYTPLSKLISLVTEETPFSLLISLAVKSVEIPSNTFSSAAVVVTATPPIFNLSFTISKSSCTTTFPVNVTLFVESAVTTLFASDSPRVVISKVFKSAVVAVTPFNLFNSAEVAVRVSPAIFNVFAFKVLVVLRMLLKRTFPDESVVTTLFASVCPTVVISILFISAVVAVT